MSTTVIGICFFTVNPRIAVQGAGTRKKMLIAPIEVTAGRGDAEMRDDSNPN
jgi:hypothetical protein